MGKQGTQWQTCVSDSPFATITAPSSDSFSAFLSLVMGWTCELSWPGPLHFWLLIVFRAWYYWQEIDEQEERSQHISIPIPFLSCHHNLAKCWVPLGKNAPTLTVASLSQFLSLLFQTAVALAFFWLVSSCLNIPFMISLNLPIPL